LARYLALDWDHREVHLVAASVGRGKVHIHRAISWREEEPFNPADAEAFGQRLKERLRQAGISAAPLIVGLGRDRVVVKEVRYPQVPAEVEAAIVRNQIVKDLTDAPDEVLMDYAPLREPSKAGERRALSLVVRKDLVGGLQTACRAAGLKMVALTARPFGTAACFRNLAGATPAVPAPPAADAVVAVLTVTGEWAEFCAVRGNQLLFARSLAVGDGLLGDVRRNLAVYAGQPNLSFPRDAIQALYVAGNGENAVLRERLQETLGIPVHGLDPFSREDRIEVEPGTRAGYTGAVGLLYLWATDSATPVNFVKPRESKPPASPVKRRALVYGILALLVFGILAYAGYALIGEREKDVAEWRAKKVKVEKRVKDLQVEIKYLEALKEWNDGAIPWIDELYDLAVRFPGKQGFRITQLTVVPLTSKGAKESKFTARMTIQGIVNSRDAKLVQMLMDKINLDRDHCRCTSEYIRATSNGNEEFSLKVDITRREPWNYYEELKLPKLAKKVDEGDLDQ
jgi:Tfp pilus assembly PilM family ATPase